ncbi:MAG: hypothetical protein H0V49_06330 [Nocardioidaceae bacterium]|nr:hypothetical protein [Nocardioidaceae bacterium]
MRTLGISLREGWHLDAGVDDEADHIVFFQAGGMIVSLWDRDRLACDSAVEDRGSWAGVTLGFCVGSSSAPADWGSASTRSTSRCPLWLRNQGNGDCGQPHLRDVGGLAEWA